MCTALHMLPVRPEIVLEVPPVLSIVVELVTLPWLSRMTEPAPPGPVLDDTVLPSREMIVLEVPLDITLWASTLVHRPNAATNVTRCFIAFSQKLSLLEVYKHSSGQGAAALPLLREV